MITTHKRYRIAQQEAAQLRERIAAAEQTPAAASIDAGTHDSEMALWRRDLEVLEGELQAYEQLAASNGQTTIEGSFDELGSLMVQARIARGWSQSEFGKRLSMPRTQINVYEQRRFDRASLSRLQHILHTLGASVSVRISLPHLTDDNGSGGS